MNRILVAASLSLVALTPAFAGGAAAPTATNPGDTLADTTVVKTADGNYTFTIRTSDTPDLTGWVQSDLAPVVKEWYPKFAEMLPSKDYQAPTNITIDFSKDMRGVAATSGTHIRCAAGWFRQNLNGEAKGAVVHELIHVIQQYGKIRHDNPDAPRPPGWLVESIADYLRWFKYEPQSHGAEITMKNFARAKYDGNYRISANFLNWVSETSDKEIVPQLNAAIREGHYGEDVWKKNTGHTVEELGTEWKEALATKLGAPNDAGGDVNTLSETEKKEGWKSLFNGRDFAGWHTFKSSQIRPGWQVKEGALVCVDPHNAGDLCTDEKFDSFELELEYNISHGGNSGIMFHVTDGGRAAWASGPEFQLEDNKDAKDPQRCGWLYALYQPPIDPSTGKTLDATKPAGEWNHIRLLITPEKCEHDINGVKYFEYVLGSDDFNARVAKSKFASMPLFAKSPTGYISLQGDHGQVSFRNIKIRHIETKK